MQVFFQKKIQNLLIFLVFVIFPAENRLSVNKMPLTKKHRQMVNRTAGVILLHYNIIS